MDDWGNDSWDCNDWDHDECDCDDWDHDDDDCDDYAWHQDTFDNRNQTRMRDWDWELQRQIIMDDDNELFAKNGCYIATCVYGSYDCPEVWTLRRFRDDCLKQSAPGRAFVRCYYALSPKLVHAFGAQRCFRNFWWKLLDPWVRKLQKQGYSDQPYHDV